MKRFLSKPSVYSVYLTLGPSRLVVEAYRGKHKTGRGLVVSFTEDFGGQKLLFRPIGTKGIVAGLRPSRRQLHLM